MKRLLAIFILMASFSRSFAGPCETEASNSSPISNRFMGLIEAALGKQAITLDDLKFVSGQQQPTQPVSPGRNIENLSLRNGFAGLLKRIGENEWRQIQSALKELIAQQLKATQTIEQAKEQTESIYTWIKQPFLNHGEILMQLVAKSGELVIVSRSSSSTTDIFYGKKHFAVPFDLDENPDILETSTGQIVISTISASRLRIIDARTGRILTDHSLDELNPIRESRITEYAGMRTLLYESPKVKGRLLVALVPVVHNPQNTPMRIPNVIFNVTNSRVERTHQSSKDMNYARLPNGHVYAYGKDRDIGTRGTLITIHDLSTDKTFFRGYYKGIHSLKDTYAVLSSSYYGKPEIYFVTNFNSSVVFHFDLAVKNVFRLNSLEKTSDARFIIDPRGQKHLYEFESIDENSVQMILQPLDPISSERRITLPKEIQNSSANGWIHGPHGEIILMTQYTGNGKIWLHILTVETGHRDSILLNASILQHPFFDAINNRLYMFDTQSTMSPSQMYQLWGPPQ